MPTNHMLPHDLAAAASLVMKMGKAKGKMIAGDELLREGYPAVHAVGRASDSLPQLIDFRWGNKKTSKKSLWLAKGCVLTQEV